MYAKKTVRTSLSLVYATNVMTSLNIFIKVLLPNIASENTMHIHTLSTKKIQTLHKDNPKLFHSIPKSKFFSIKIDVIHGRIFIFLRLNQSKNDCCSSTHLYFNVRSKRLNTQNRNCYSLKWLLILSYIYGQIYLPSVHFFPLVSENTKPANWPKC